MLAWLSARDCYRAGWELAGRLESSAERLRPACLFAATNEHAVVRQRSTAAMPQPFSDEELDAGDMGCGELVMELRLRLAPLEPGTVLRVRALDPAAPVDLPAWCGLTAHRLLSARHPFYWIERRPERPPEHEEDST